MKRDMDLVRKILLAIEAEPKGRTSSKFSVKGYSKESVYYHVGIMIDAGLIESVYRPAFGPFHGQEMIVGEGLTWFGHDFLESARDDTRWRRANSIMKNIGSASLDILIQILAQIMTEQMKQAMGSK